MSSLLTRLIFGLFRSPLWKSKWGKFYGEKEGLKFARPWTPPVLACSCSEITWKRCIFGQISTHKLWKSIVAWTPPVLACSSSKNSVKMVLFRPDFYSKTLEKQCFFGWISSPQKLKDRIACDSQCFTMDSNGKNIIWEDGFSIKSPFE